MGPPSTGALIAITLVLCTVQLATCVPWQNAGSNIQNVAYRGEAINSYGLGEKPKHYDWEIDDEEDDIFPREPPEYPEQQYDRHLPVGFPQVAPPGRPEHDEVDEIMSLLGERPGYSQEDQFDDAEGEFDWQSDMDEDFPFHHELNPFQAIPLPASDRPFASGAQSYSPYLPPPPLPPPPPPPPPYYDARTPRPVVRGQWLGQFRPYVPRAPPPQNDRFTKPRPRYDFAQLKRNKAHSMARQPQAYSGDNVYDKAAIQRALHAHLKNTRNNNNYIDNRHYNHHKRHHYRHR